MKCKEKIAELNAEFEKIDYATMVTYDLDIQLKITNAYRELQSHMWMMQVPFINDRKIL